MEFNNALMGFPAPTMRNFQSKAEALQFAIEFTASTSMGGRKADLAAAKELYDFICKNVELPDTPLTQWKDVINQADDIAKIIKECLVQTINAQKANENTAK